MNSLTKASCAVMFALMAAALHVPAQPNATPTRNNRSGRVVLPDKPANADTINATSLQERPDRLERNELSPEVKAQLQRFKRERESFLQQQEALRKQFQNASTAEERRRIRAQFNALLDQWRQRNKALKQRFEERREQLRDKLPNHREVLDSVPADARRAGLQQLKEEMKSSQDGTTTPRDRRGDE